MKKLTSLLLALCLLTASLSAFAEAAIDESERRFYSEAYTFYVIDDDPDFMNPTQFSSFTTCMTCPGWTSRSSAT